MVQAEVLKNDNFVVFGLPKQPCPVHCRAGFLFVKAVLPDHHLFTPGGGTGKGLPLGHFPLPEMLPVSRPEASRWVVELPLEFVAPVKRPDASRNWVRLPLPVTLLVLALPAILPLVSC